MTATLAGALLATGSGASAAAIRVPPGFAVSVYARGLSAPTAMTFGPDGRLYVTETGGKVVAIGASRRSVAFAGGFRTLLGLAWHGTTLYVSRAGGLDSVRLAGHRAAGRRAVLSGLPYSSTSRTTSSSARTGASTSAAARPATSAASATDGARRSSRSDPTDATSASSRAGSATRTGSRFSRRR